MKTIAFCNIKGGVLKTTSVLNIGDMMARAGKKVLLIDLDHQSNLTNRLNPQTTTLGNLMQLINNGIYCEEGNYIGSLLADPNAKTTDYILHTRTENLYYIPCSLALADAKNKLLASAMPQFSLKNHLDQVSDQFDYCLIDCAPSVDILVYNAMMASDEVYFPTKVDCDSISGMFVARESAKAIQQYKPGLRIGGAFFVAVQSTLSLTSEAMRLLLHCCPQMYIPLVISHSKTGLEASYTQRSCFDSDPKMKLRITREYYNLTNYLMSDDKPAYLQNLYHASSPLTDEYMDYIITHKLYQEVYDGI